MKENPNIRVELSLTRQSSIILAAKFFGFVLSFFLPILIVRFMPQDEIGVYRQVFLIINSAVTILPLGMGMSAYYFLSREPELRNPAVFNIFIFLFLLGGLLFAGLNIYPDVLNLIFRHDQIGELAPFIAIVIWLWLVGGFLEVVILANREVWLASFAIVGIQLSKAISMLLAVFLAPSAEGFLTAAIIQGALQFLLLLVYLKIRFPGFYSSFDVVFFRKHVAYALPLGLAGILWVFQSDLHNYFVSYRFTAAEFAIYAYGCFQLPLINLMIESVTAVMIPKISELQMQNDKRAILDLGGRSMHKLALIFLPLYAFLLVTAETFIFTLFSMEYQGSVPIFMINLTLIPFAIWINDPIVRAYPELGKFLLYLRIFLLVSMTAVIYFIIDRLGLEEMIMVVVVVALTEKAILTFAVLRKLEPRRSDLAILKRPLLTAIAAAAAAGTTFALHNLFAGSVHTRMLVSFNSAIPDLSSSLADTLANGIVFLASAAVFLPVYLFVIMKFRLIELPMLNSSGRLNERIRKFWS